MGMPGQFHHFRLQQHAEDRTLARAPDEPVRRSSGRGSLGISRPPEAGWREPGGPAPLRARYRAPYVRDVARLVASGEGNLHELQHMSHAGARRTLLALPGVGEKVADCVLLFACGSGEAFPVDVWVKRAVERWYFHGRRTTARQIQEFARSRFGPLAGY